MAQRMDNRGEILSCDVHPHRVELMEQLFARLQVQIASPVCHDATEPGMRGDGRGAGGRALLGLEVLAHKPDLKARVQPGDIDALCAAGAHPPSGGLLGPPTGRLVYCTSHHLPAGEGARWPRPSPGPWGGLRPADLTGGAARAVAGRWGCRPMVQLDPLPGRH